MAAKTSKSKAKASKPAKSKAKAPKARKTIKTKAKTPKAKSPKRAVAKKVAPKAIAFNFYAPESKVIKVGGDFNKWKTAKLKSTKSGIWSTSLKLKPGRYEYRFVVDGCWENDNQRQTELVDNGHGQDNNVLVIS
jgi:1,4-alpha-glucan branching enzyme